MDKDKVLEIARECGVAFGPRLLNLVDAIEYEAIEQCAKLLDECMWGYTLKAGITKKWLLSAIRNMGKEG